MTLPSVPAHDLRSYLEPVVLRDGGSMIVRAIRPDDKARLADHFAHLGAESVRHRFFGMKRELTATELAYYTELDFADHVGLVATLDDATGERGHRGEQIIGVGRYCASGHRAEVAFAVVDEHQGRGIGSVLLEHLIAIARASGIDELEADVLDDNAAMLALFRASGFALRARASQGVVHVVFPITPTDGTIPVRPRDPIAADARVHQAPD